MAISKFEASDLCSVVVSTSSTLHNVITENDRCIHNVHDNSVSVQLYNVQIHTIPGFYA